MDYKAGTRLYSAVCDTEVIVVKAPPADGELLIGGVLAVRSADERDPEGAVVYGHGGGAQMGKRYVDQADTAELLCTKQGAGRPALNGEVLTVKAAKPLPASD